ncbi:MAG: hypothetical protein KJ727_07175 [Acidobacteria bacterium]|nr:hypothetical protein [Acidobacteriota bacterium]
MKRIGLLFCLLPPLVFPQTEQKTDVWEPLRFLEGTWEGTGDGFSGQSVVEQSYTFILNGNFLQMQTRSEFKPQEKNPEGEIHEDMGIFSYDAGRKLFILRGFYIEGFVNQYVLETMPEDGKILEFMTETVENAPSGTKAKLVFNRIDMDKIERSFFVAWPGRDYSCFSVNTLVKK